MSTRVVAAVIRHGQQVLIARRASHKADGGCWEFPGGKVEAGESDSEALMRELDEELRCRIDVGGWLGAVQHPSRPLQLHAYWCALADGQSLPAASSDHDCCRWASAAELPQLQWAPLDPPLLPLIIATLNKAAAEPC